MATYLLTLSINSLNHRVVIATPRKWKKDSSKPAIIVCPGTAETYTFPFSSTIGQPLVQQLLDAGFPVALISPSSTVGGVSNLWASDNALNFITALRTHMQSTAVGAKPGKIGLIGLSQGVLNVLAWAGNNPSLTGAITAYLPNTDLYATSQNATYGASVNAAYGGTYNEGIHGATHNPITMANANKYTGIPINLVYASNDSVIPLSYPTAFQVAVGSNAVLINGGATDHDWSVTWNNPATITALITQMNGF